jgi:hypothetical protein
MGNESGTWIMYGVDRNDPECIHTVEEAVDYINTVGFLPLFKNEIPGFSLEERTVPYDWWCDDPGRDPWIWRTIIAGQREVAYGKFFDKKAGFISKKWLPIFANYRRDGYDFDALYEDGKAPRKHKKIMDNFMEDNEDSEILSSELKRKAGFGKGGEKGFDGAITNLMMQLYLCNCDFRRRKNKKGEEYGWQVAVYSSPEHLYGYDHVTSCYRETSSESWQRIVDYMKEAYPIATEKQIRKVLG